MKKDKIVCRTCTIIVSFDNKLWPCCWVCTAPEESDYLKTLDENWNSLDHHSATDIFNHAAFKEHFNKLHWASERHADPICKRNCSKSV